MNNNAEIQQIKVLPMVEIQTDEYMEYVKFKAKMQTVEIPLQQYNDLREENICLRGKIWDLENQIRDLECQLEREIERREEINKHTDVVTETVADGIAEKIKKLLQLPEEQKKEIREKQRKM